MMVDLGQLLKKLQKGHITGTQFMPISFFVVELGLDSETMLCLP